MPYGRKNYRKRPMRATRRRRPTVKKLATKVREIASSIELKALDTDLSSAVTSSTGSCTAITTIAPGDDHNDRSGDKVLIKKIELIGTVAQNASATQTQFRMLLGRVRHTTAGAPSSIASTGTGPLESASPVALRAFDQVNGKQSFLLMDKLLTMDAAKGESYPIRYSKSYKNGIQVVWDKDDTDGTLFRDNPFYVGFVSNEATNVPDFNGFVRVWYKDA